MEEGQFFCASDITESFSLYFLLLGGHLQQSGDVHGLNQISKLSIEGQEESLTLLLMWNLLLHHLSKVRQDIYSI